MKDQNKTKAQLMAELTEMRQRIATLEAAEAQRVRAEKALCASEQKIAANEKRFRALVENSAEVIALIDSEGRILYESPAAMRILGYDLEGMVGRNALEFIHPDDHAGAAVLFAQILQQVNQVITNQLRYRHVDGSYRWVEFTAANMLAEPAVGAIVVNYHDVTGRVQAEGALRKSEERYRLIAQNAEDVIWTTNMDLQLTYVSPSFERALGYPAEGVMALTPEQLLTPESLATGLKAYIEEVAAAQPQPDPNYARVLELEYCRKDGSTFWVEMKFSFFRDAAGRPVGVLGVGRDITQRKQTEHELRESEERYRNLFEDSPIPLWEEDFSAVKKRLDALRQEGVTDMRAYLSSHLEVVAECAGLIRVNDVNTAAVVLHRAKSKQDLIENLPTIFGDQTYREFAEELANIAEGKSKFEWEGSNRTLDGERLDIRLSWAVAPGYEEDLSKVIVSTADITERKQAEAELRRRASEFAALYETARDLAVQHDLPTLLHAIVGRARDLLHAPGGGIYLYDSARGDLEMVLTVGTSAPSGARLQMGEGMAGRVAQTRQPLIVDDYHTWGGRSQQYEDIPFRAVVQVPMLYAGELIGVLAVDEIGESQRKFSEADAHLLSLFAEYAAGAVHAVRLLQETHRHAEETTALLETSLALTSLDLETTLQTIGNHAKSLFVADGCRIFLMEPDDETLRCVLALQESPVAFSQLKIKIGEGVTGAVAASGQAEIINEMQNDPRAVHVPGTPEEQEAIMFAPLKERERTIGVLSIRRVGTERPFQPADLALLEAFASMAASAVSNARLLQATQRRLERLSSLRDIDQFITSSLDLRVTLNMLLGHILQRLEVNAAAVLLYQPGLQSLDFVAGQGFRTRALQSTSLHLGEGFAGRAVLERRTVLVSDLRQLETGFLRSPEFHNEGFVNYIGVPLLAKGNIVGVLEIYHRQPFDPDREWMEFLETLAGQAAIAIDNIRLFEDLQSSNMQLRQAYDATIEGWAQALELRDMETVGHSQRAVDLTLDLARMLGIEESQLAHVRRGALLHDIGKMGVPDAILQKPGPLTDEEWEIMRQHPVHAYNWLAPILYLQPALAIPSCHHEKWDGTGYPRGLKGEQIPLAARIFAVVDVWDALRSDRPYRDAWSQEKILAYLREQSGQHFDPRVVQEFITLLIEKGYI